MNIFQIYHDKSLIPDFVENHIKKLNPGYKYNFINFDEGKKLIKKDFKNIDIKEKILYCIDNYPRYCHRSDLLRYCLLYMYGGVYIDVDLKPLIPFKEMKSNDITFFSSFGRGGKPILANNTYIYPITSNGIIISNKNNPILLDLINYALKNEKLFNKNPHYRGINVFYLYHYLNKKCQKNDIIFEPFKKLELDGENVFMVNHVLFRDKNLDYIMYENKPIIHTNDKKYEFKRQTSSVI